MFGCLQEQFGMSLGVLTCRGMHILYTPLLIIGWPYCIFQLKLRTVYKHIVACLIIPPTKVEKYNIVIYTSIKTLVIVWS